MAITETTRHQLLKRAALIDAARKRDWSGLPEMFDLITSKDRDEVFATSLIRMVPPPGTPRIVPALYKATKDPSPLVRAAAADCPSTCPTEEAFRALLRRSGMTTASSGSGPLLLSSVTKTFPWGTRIRQKPRPR